MHDRGDLGWFYEGHASLIRAVRWDLSVVVSREGLDSGF